MAQGLICSTVHPKFIIFDLGPIRLLSMPIALRPCRNEKKVHRAVLGGGAFVIAEQHAGSSKQPTSPLLRRLFSQSRPAFLPLFPLSIDD